MRSSLLASALALVLAGATTPLAAPGSDATLAILRVESHDADAAPLARGFDVIGPTEDGRALLVVASAGDRAHLEELGVAFTVVERGAPLSARAATREADDRPPPRAAPESADGTVPTGYPTLGAIYAEMLAAADAFPAICSFENVTAALGAPATEEGRSLFALRISDAVGADEDEPAALVLGCAHAREIVTPLIALDVVERLTTGYGVDAELTALVDGWDLWVLPVANPDGYVHVFDVDNLWRKNRRVFVDGVGVDVNRNFPTGWDAPCSGSTIPSLITYKGPSAASEAETQTLMALTEQRRFARVIDFHSAGQEVLWGYACIAHPFDAWLQAEATALSIASGYQGAERRPSAEGEHYEWQLARGAYAFLIETATTFQPSFAAALAEVALVWPGTLAWLERPTSLSGHVTDALSGAPLAATITLPDETFVNGEAFSSGGPFGRYDLVLPPGTHEIVFATPGHAPRIESVTVTATSALGLDVALDPIAVPGTWTDVGAAKRGVAGAPVLSGSGTLAPGGPQALALAGAAPSASASLVLGLDVLLASFKGGTLVPEPLLIVPLATDGGGGLLLPFVLPAGIPAATSLFFQTWIVDAGASGGLSASNGLWAVTG